MKIVIDQAEFRRLSSATREEILFSLTGKAPSAPAKAPASRTQTRVQWRWPVDITADQAVKLVHGLSEDHKRRLALFTRKSGRVRMKEIMSVASDTDLRSISHFERVMTRRLRRMIDDPDHKAQLIGWDFDATKWDAGRTTIVDGVYYVSEETARALRTALPKETRREG
ncbi:MAG: hypothetical protein ACE5DS_04765 [Kiloniellaceae bacterium]